MQWFVSSSRDCYIPSADSGRDVLVRGKGSVVRRIYKRKIETNFRKNKTFVCLLSYLLCYNLYFTKYAKSTFIN